MLAPADEDQKMQLKSAVEKDDHPRVVELATQLIEQGSPPDATYYYRARAYFCLSKMDESVADFDKFVQLRPDVETKQWERGLAYYYAGKFKEGAKQFADYQTYESNDVENSVWRFLCLVPVNGVEETHRTMLPIRQDPRVPMMAIYDMYRGKLSPKEVFAAAEAGQPDSQDQDSPMFYAKLYVGLYELAVNKDEEKGKKYLGDAVRDYRDSKSISRYMWSVADVHARKLKINTDAPPAKKPQ